MINLDKYKGRDFGEAVKDIAVSLGYPSWQDVNAVVESMVKNGYYPCIGCEKVLPIGDFDNLYGSGKCKNCS